VSATLTIDRTNLGLGDYVIGVDPAAGRTLDPALSIGSVTWRKETEVEKNVAGRTMTDYTRAEASVVGSLTLHASDEVDLQTKLAEAIEALCQVDPVDGFRQFPMTYEHGAAIYQWTCTEPADVTPGASSTAVLDDAELAVFVQAVGFTIIRDPIALQGPI
jgi:hypothetical protein